MSNYANISDFGNNSCSEALTPIQEALSHCLPRHTSHLSYHGSAAAHSGPHSDDCKSFLAEYCAYKWDKVCDTLASDKEAHHTNKQINAAGEEMNNAEAHIRKTAGKKYIVGMKHAEKFHRELNPVSSRPITVTHYRATGNITPVPVYMVDPKSIDQDPVMQRILESPQVYMDILINIYNSMKQAGKLQSLKGTRLGYFYTTNYYFSSRGGLM